MNTFANAVANQMTTTTNGMAAHVSSGKACTDLFYSIGASRGKNIVPAFVKAFVENPEVAVRIALWGRDARKGAGERQLFRDIFQYLERSQPEIFDRVANKVPELGRWDDLLAVNGSGVGKTFSMIATALKAGDGLCAKWMPRKGAKAQQLRGFLGLSPKAYRKLIVGLTKVVEQQMCAKDWDNINFSHVPSVAAARYRNAFQRNTTKFAEYVTALASGDKSVKVNAAAVYPHIVIQSLMNRFGSQLNAVDHNFIQSQWEALPNYINDARILPVVDVSGSMFCPAGGSGSVQCIDISVALGLYCADKNTGPFKDVFCTFSENPELEVLTGNIVQKVQQLKDANWGMSTNIEATFNMILRVAKENRVSPDQMPTMVLIFSDMQFNSCARDLNERAMDMVRRSYTEAGYEVPKIVFWNLNAHNNVPVTTNEYGAALVSGFSPALMTALLADDLEDFTPEAVMLKTVMSDRYDF